MEAKDFERSTDGQSISPPPIGLAGSAVLFGGAGLLLFGITHGVIPTLAARSEVEPVLLWFASAGLGLFVPLLFVTLVLLRREDALRRPGVWRERLRFRRMDRADYAWSTGGLVAVGLLVAVCMTALEPLLGEANLHPPFMKMQPLTGGRYWILVAWLPFWVVNIMGEEILWRGVVLPRQEVAFGRWAWLVNGTGWLLFHLPFGLAILLILAPTTLILPYVVQRRRNSWIGVAIHAGLNGPAFVAIALGFV